MCHAKYKASAAWLVEDRFDAIAKNIPPLAIRPWRWLGAKFFARGDAFMCAAENGIATEKKDVRCGSAPTQNIHFNSSDLIWTMRGNMLRAESVVYSFGVAWRARRDSNSRPPDS